MRRKRKNIFDSKGKIHLVIIVLMLIIGLTFTGTLFIKQEKFNPSLTAFPGALAQCCDTGDGEACKPQTEQGQTITFKGKEYGLLRSNTQFIEGNAHLEDTGFQKDGNPIIRNASGDINYQGLNNPDLPAECRVQGKDKFFKQAISKEEVGDPRSARYCTALDDDIMIFVCKKDCFPSACQLAFYGNPKCYGDENSIYDIYFRIDDYNRSGIPDFVRYCDKSKLPTPGPNNTVFPEQEIVFRKDASDTPDLQLDDFYIKQELSSIYVPWVSPFCKPAIYLYPEKSSYVSVKVQPKGKMTLTIPQYPPAGWNILAHPNGQLSYFGKPYDYLYYEAEIPDSLIKEPDEGYSVKKEELDNFLSTLLPQLGLNAHESTQFREYWTDALPDSPYYTVKVVPESNIDLIAPLEINPKPQTVKRVALIFKTSQTKQEFSQPSLEPFKRSGFTVIEWGGIFKKQKGENFSCFM